MTAIPGDTRVQAVLSPAGREALEIDALFWLATAVSVAVTLLVLVAIIVALRGPAHWRARLGGERIILVAGVMLPIVVLTFLLGYGFAVLQAGVARSAQGAADAVTITGKRWWWEVSYVAGGVEVISANELRLPVGRPVVLRLQSADVIHSFWAPRLAGKLDMIPGRVNVLTIQATEAGISRGQCAEYCGGAHALMSFYVIAMPAADFDAWLRREAAPARAPASGLTRRGLDLFFANGCGGCHAIRGTRANGAIGPDLTHVGSRLSLAAAALPNDTRAFVRWIADNQHVKPENLMPEYPFLEPAELASIGAYLESLE